jgi:hypothetical protein
MQGAGYLAIWSDLAPQDETDWAHWITREHAAERVGINGFLACRIFRALGVSVNRYFILYELEDERVIGGPDRAASSLPYASTPRRPRSPLHLSPSSPASTASSPRESCSPTSRRPRSRPARRACEQTTTPSPPCRSSRDWTKPPPATPSIMCARHFLPKITVRSTACPCTGSPSAWRSGCYPADAEWATAQLRLTTTYHRSRVRLRSLSDGGQVASTTR